jgi:hypothetical protein
MIWFLKVNYSSDTLHVCISDPKAFFARMTRVQMTSGLVYQQEMFLWRKQRVLFSRRILQVAFESTGSFSKMKKKFE